MPAAKNFPAILVELETLRAAGRAQYDTLLTVKAEIARGGNEVEMAEYEESAEFIQSEMSANIDKIFAASRRAKLAGIKFSLATGGIIFAGRKLVIAA